MDAFLKWLAERGGGELLTTVGLLLAAAVTYLLFTRYVFGAVRSVRARRLQRTVLLLGLGALLLAGLIWIWRGYFDALGALHARLREGAIYSGIVWTVLVGLVIYLVSRGVQAQLLKNATTLEARHRVRRSTGWIGTGAFLLVAAFIWGSNIQDPGVFFGILGAGLALSMQETLLCIAGWALVVWNRLFTIGDRIEVNGQKGDVIDIGIFHTVLLEVGNWVDAEQSTGRLLIVPNSNFFRHFTFNYTEGFPFLWNELAITLTFESDWKRAKAIMLAQAQEEAAKIEEEVRRQIRAMQGHYAIHYQRLTPIVYTRIAASGVLLTLRYLVPARRRRTMDHEIAEGILEDFAKESRVDFAYPTTRFYQNPQEGKSGLGGPARPPVGSSAEFHE
jgi:small-conductance mechanosensitive channel